MEEHEYTIVINVNLEDMQDTDITDRESLYEFIHEQSEVREPGKHCRGIGHGNFRSSERRRR